MRSERIVVIPVAGEATRMGELSSDTPKCLLRTGNNRTLLEQIVKFWDAERTIVIMKDHIGAIAAEMDRVVKSMWGDAKHWVPVYSAEKTLSQSIKLCAPWIDHHFVVVMGDCLWDGEFEEGWVGVRGLAVAERGCCDWSRSYAVDVNRVGGVVGVIEKPLLGLGAWWFHGDDIEIFGAREGMEGVVRKVSEAASVKFTSVTFAGHYLNVTYPEDLKRWES